MKAGELRHVLELQNPVDVSDAQGGITRTWSVVEKVRASVRFASARERFNAGQMQNVITHMVGMRFLSAVKHTSRFLFGSDLLYVVEINNVNNRDRWLMLECVEGPDQ